MDKKRTEGYIAGVACVIACLVFSVSAANIGWNASGQILWAFTIVFGVLGIGSFWKPNSIGAIVTQIMRNIGRSESEGSDSHNRQIQKKSKGSVQVMGDDARVNVYNVAQESDANGNTLWKPRPKIKFFVAQELLRKLQFPQVGWEAYNDSPYQLRARIEIHPILGGHDLFPLSDDYINGNHPYGVEPKSPVFGNGCFSLPQVCATSKDELVLEIRAIVEDVNDPEKGEYKLLPSCWKYAREYDTWSYNP